MKAPRHKVMTKLLAAHQHRSIRMISEFNEKCHKSATSKSKGDSSTMLSVESLQDLATARQFHQNVLVGLIEACKGIFELYDPNQSNRGGGATPGRDVHEAEAVSPKDIAQAYELLRQMIAAVMKDYTKAFSTAFHLFFEGFQTYFNRDPMDFSTLLETKDLEILEELKKQIVSVAKDAVFAAVSTAGNDASSSSSSSSSSTSEFHATNLLELYEERTSWLMLARQAILDVIYLDSTLKDTAIRQLGISFKDSTSSTTAIKVNVTVPNHGNVFSDAILQEVHKNNTAMRKVFVNHLVQHVESYWLPKIALLTHGKDRLTYFLHHPDATKATDKSQQQDSQYSSSHSSHGGAIMSTPVVMNGRSILQQHCTLMNTFFDIMKSQCLETFHECLRFYKPVLDIYEAIGRERSMFLLLCAELTSAFVTDFLQAVTLTSSCQMKINYSTQDGNVSGHRKSSSRGSSHHNKSFDDDDESLDPCVDEIFDSEAYEKIDPSKSGKVSDTLSKLLYYYLYCIIY